MPRPAILAIDQGTTNTKALLVTLDGVLTGRGSVATTMAHPRAGWAEQCAGAIRDATAQAVAMARTAAPEVEPVAIAISNQRETVIAWDGATGAPVGPAVLWQCRRSADLCHALRTAGHGSFVQSRSGLGLDPLFSAGKLRWLIDNISGARDMLDTGRLRMGTVDSWLLWNLTGGAVHATDVGNASRTQLLNLDTATWDDDLLSLFGVPRSPLPHVLPSDSLFGETSGGFAGLPDGIPIHAVMGDSHAALFGQSLAFARNAKVTIGTGSSLMCPVDARRSSRHGLSDTIAWAAGGKIVYALEGNIAVSGHAAAFGCEMLGLPDPDALTTLAHTVEDTGGVVFLPALAGMGAPHWDDRARGLLCGLSLATRRGHIARAVLEGIAHQICDVIDAMEADLGSPLPGLSIDGSAARNDMLAAMLADLSTCMIYRPSQTELSAIGVAAMAAQAMGHAIAADPVDAGRTFTPVMQPDLRASARSAWHDAVKRASSAR